MSLRNKDGVTALKRGVRALEELQSAKLMIFSSDSEERQFPAFRRKRGSLGAISQLRDDGDHLRRWRDRLKTGLTAIGWRFEKADLHLKLITLA